MPDSKQFRIVQLNAENLFLFFDEPLKKKPQEYSEKEWSRLSSARNTNKNINKALALAAAIKDIQPDLVMLNEVGGEESLNNFNKYFLDSHFIPHLIEGNSERGIDCGYLLRQSLPLQALLKSHKDVPLHFLYPHERNNPYVSIKTHYFSRDCLELRLFDPTSNQLKLITLLVHLKSKLDPDGIDPDGRERRAAELLTLLRIYQDIERETGGQIPICIGGDFNGISRSIHHEPEFLPIYKTTQLKDVFDICAREEVERATQIQINRQGRIDYLQIDCVFASPALQPKVDCNGTYVYRYKNELGIAAPFPQTLEQRLQLPSDHYPVVVTFTSLL